MKNIALIALMLAATTVFARVPIPVPVPIPYPYCSDEQIEVLEDLAAEQCGSVINTLGLLECKFTKQTATKCYANCSLSDGSEARLKVRLNADCEEETVSVRKWSLTHK